MKKFFIILFSFIFLLQPSLSFAGTPNRRRCFWNSLSKIANGFVDVGRGIKKAVDCARNKCEDTDIDENENVINQEKPSATRRVVKLGNENLQEEI